MQQFRDDAGLEWDVFAVEPTGRRELLPLDYQAGWLTFERDGERRRLAPIPAGWSDLGEDELTRLLNAARSFPPSNSRPITRSSTTIFGASKR